MSKHVPPPMGTPVAAPVEKPQEALYVNTPITPEEAFQAIGRLRKDARDEIYRLIRFLDKTDDYMSRELEEDSDDEPGGDDEPSLGSFDRVEDQSKAWRPCGEFCSGDDLEQDDADAEPSLGSVGEMHFTQELWAIGSRRDLEFDGGESGVADQDGLDEQTGPQDWQPIFFV